AKVYDHLICVGFKKGYLNWTDHGESNEVSSSSMMENDEDEDNDHEMHEILHDLFPTVSMERSICERETERERDFNREKQNDKKKFDDLVKDVDQKAYPSCMEKYMHVVTDACCFGMKMRTKKYVPFAASRWRPNQKDNSGDESRNESGDESGDESEDESGDEAGDEAGDEVGMQDESGMQDEAENPRNNNLSLPKACYEMTREEKDTFLETLKSIKPPDEYSSNISCCVQLKERKLMGMKIYDCHMLMQEYLPIALRGTLPDYVSEVVIELCDFFRQICLKDLIEDDLRFLESQVVVTLCKMEQFFPPSLFTVMVHLVIHLIREVRFGGPIPLRWMYPIEREHKSIIRGQNRSHRPSEYELQKIHCQKFSEWFRNRVTRLEEQRDPRVTEEIKPVVVNYYGSLKDIIELNYSVKYTQLEGWLAVRNVKVTDAFNMRCDNDDNSLASFSCALDIPNLDRVGVDADEVVDGTLVIESEEEVDEEEDEVHPNGFAVPQENKLYGILNLVKGLQIQLSVDNLLAMRQMS
nr:hypothetical protein [Tanacetum cinerariifolium]